MQHRTWPRRHGRPMFRHLFQRAYDLKQGCTQVSSSMIGKERVAGDRGKRVCVSRGGICCWSV